MPKADADGPALAGKTMMQHVRIAEIEIDPARVDEYRAALREEIETSIRVEPGVLASYAIHEKENPSHVRILEIYANAGAYESHMASPHFLEYKTATQGMVRSLKLVEAAPIMLGAKLG